MKTKIQLLLSQLNHGLVEREVALKAGLLSVLSGENIVLIGPPGTGKSLVARRIAECLRDEKDAPAYFEYLLTKFTTPEEIFGPLSITELKADRFKRNTTGYLPTVRFAFLDEIFKSSSSILNALLTILNERIYHNGANPQYVPLQTLIAASNELPSDQDELRALYDRFLVRIFVDYVRPNNLCKLFELTGEMPALDKLTVDDLKTITTNAESVKIPPEIVEAIQRIWLEFKECFKNDRREYLSDRRLKKIIKLISVSAATNGREEVDFSDLLLLKDCLWNHPENAIRVRDLILDVLRTYSRSVAQVTTNEVPTFDGAAETTGSIAAWSTRDIGQLNAVVKGYKGRGTEGDPILIENFHDLMGLEQPEVGRQGYYFRQTADIDCSELTSWMKIDFKGHFDGRGCIIRHKKISPAVAGGHLFSAKSSHVPSVVECLFSKIHPESTVTNLVLDELSLAELAENCIVDHCVSSACLIADNANGCDILACESGMEIVKSTAANTLLKGCKAKSYLIGKNGKDTTVSGCYSAKGVIKENAEHCVISDCLIILGQALNREKDAGIAQRLTKSSIVERCYVGGMLETRGTFYGIASSCQESSIRDCALGTLNVCAGSIGYRIAPPNSKSVLENNVSIDSNLASTDSPANGKTVAAALLGQRYFEHTLGWEFAQTWSWDDASNRPALRSIGISAVLNPSITSVDEDGMVDLLSQQIRTNIWL